MMNENEAEWRRISRCMYFAARSELLRMSDPSEFQSPVLFNFFQDATMILELVDWNDFRWRVLF